MTLEDAARGRRPGIAAGQSMGQPPPPESLPPLPGVLRWYWTYHAAYWSWASPHIAVILVLNLCIILWGDVAYDVSEILGTPEEGV